MSELGIPFADRLTGKQKKRICQLRALVVGSALGFACYSTVNAVSHESVSEQVAAATENNNPHPTNYQHIDTVINTTSTTSPRYQNPTNAEILAELRDCETGGDYQANTGNGFYGAYQFLDETWDKLGTGYDRADFAPAHIQDSAALHAARIGGGFSQQFPGCYADRNLPNYPIG